MKWWPHLYAEEDGERLQVWPYEPIDLEELASLVPVDGDRTTVIWISVSHWGDETVVMKKVHSFVDFKPGQEAAIVWQRWDAVNGWTHWQGARCKPRKVA